MMIFISKISFQDNSSVYRKYYKIYFFYFIMALLNFVIFEKIKNFYLYYTIQMALIVYSTVGNIVFTSSSVFINKMVDKNAGATFLSVMNSLSNIPTLMFNPLFTWSMNFGYKKPALFVLILHGTFTFFFLDKMIDKISKTKRE